MFDQTQFQDLLSAMENAVKDFKKTAIFFQENLKVEKNEWFGVDSDGDRTVDVLWVINNRVDDWENKINDEQIKCRLKDRFSLKSELWMFPWYKTVSQLHLTPRMVNMLSHLACWTVTTKDNKSDWNKIFD